MPVYHFTLHAYNSWNADHPEGYYQHDLPGKQRPNPALAYIRHKSARQPTIAFSPEDRTFLLTAAKEAATRRNLNLYAVTAIENHLHLIAAWNEKERTAKDTQSHLKRSLGYLLAKHHNTKGIPYFSHGGTPEPITSRTHLLHLLTTYFPDHNGPRWTNPALKNFIARHTK